MTRYWWRTAGETVVPFACDAGTLNSTVCMLAPVQWPAVSSMPPWMSQPVQPTGMMRPTKT